MVQRGLWVPVFTGSSPVKKEASDMRKALLTKEEYDAVACLERLAKRWPSTIRLVLCQGTRELRVCLSGEVADSDDLAQLPGVHIRGIKVDSHS